VGMDRNHESIIHGLLASYEEIGGINHLDGTNLPSKASITLICEELLGLLFPGFLDEGVTSSSCVKEMTRARVQRVEQVLRETIFRCLPCQRDRADVGVTETKGPCQEQAGELTNAFLQGLPSVRRLVHTDVQAAFDGDPAAESYEEIILSYPCVEAIAIQRMAHQLYRLKAPLLPRMMTEWAHSRTGIDIHPGAEIGPHFFIDHGTGVVIGETAVIGCHVKLYQGVGLVARSLAAGQGLKGKRRHPTLEDRVTIYANATIVGGATVIGAGSTIGANVFLMSSVEPGQTVTLKDQDYAYFSKDQNKRP
jgi:serine O-acetyltransferase